MISVVPSFLYRLHVVVVGGYLLIFMVIMVVKGGYLLSRIGVHVESPR
jgi:hypothetical protein